MRTAVLVSVLATVVVHASAGMEPGSLGLTNATVVDIRTGRLLRAQTIVITGDRITALSRRGEIPLTPR